MNDDYSGNTDHREWRDRFEDNDDWQQYDIVMFKSCFPASHIDSPALLRQYKRVYRRTLAPIFAQHPDILFIVVTAPPLVPNETSRAAANRARKFNKWLGGAFLRKYNARNPAARNVAVFDFFDLLANPAAPDRNMLRTAYRLDAWDSHPNAAGSRDATREFVPFLRETADDWVRTTPSR